MNWLPHLPYIISLLMVGGFWYLDRRQTQKSHQATVAAYERLLARRDEEYTTLADRSFALKNLPPSGIDMTVEHEERREERRQSIQRKNGGPVPSRIGPVDRVQMEMELARQRERLGDQATH